MAEFRLFIGFFIEALKAFPRSKAALVFGAILTVGTSPSFLKTGAPLEQIISFLEMHPGVLFAIPLIIAVAAFAKGGLVLALSKKNITLTATTKKSAALFPKLYALEMLFLISVSTILAAFLFPAMLTTEIPSLSLNLEFLGLAVFLPVFVILIFIEIYAFFHIILSGTSLRSSIELGYALFMKRSVTSLLFGALSLLMLTATALLTGALLGIGNIIASDSPERTIIAMMMLFLIQSGFAIIQKDAWLSFFRFIGTEKKGSETTSQKEENVVQKEVPEIG